jgi:hypothetical protein
VDVWPQRVLIAPFTEDSNPTTVTRLKITLHPDILLVHMTHRSHSFFPSDMSNRAGGEVYTLAYWLYNVMLARVVLSCQMDGREIPTIFFYRNVTRP